MATRTKKAPAIPTEEEILGSNKAELLSIIEAHNLEEDIETSGKRVGEIRDSLISHFYPEDSEEEEDEDEVEEAEEDPEEDDEEDDEEDEPAPRSRKSSSATRTPRTSAKPKASSVDDEDPDWDELLNQLASEAGDLFFLKDGRTQIRIVLEDPKNKKSFYHEAVRQYRGQKRRKFLVRAVMMKNDPPVMKAVVVPTTAFRSILQLLAEGYDLFGKEGHGITIRRQGSGFDTTYTVMPSPKPVPVPRGVGELDKTLAEIAESLEESDAERDETRDGDEDEKPARGRGGRGGARGGSSSRGGRTRRASNDDDEDEGDW